MCERANRHYPTPEHRADLTSRIAKLRQRLVGAVAKEEPGEATTPTSPVGEVALALYMSLVFAALFFALLMLCQWLLHKPLGYQIGLVFLLLEGLLIYGSFFLWKRLFKRARDPDEPNTFSFKVAQTLLSLGYATVAFAALSAVLIRHKWLLTATGVRPHDAYLSYDAAETYLWNLVAAIPVLDLTDTFNWTRHLQLTNEAGGLLILAYKLALVIPLLTLCGIVIWEQPD